MLFKLIYLAVLALAIPLEHFVFKEYSELIRRGMGIVTVMILALILVWLNVFVDSFDVWFWIFLGFCEAGALLIMMTNYEKMAEEKRQAHTRQNVLEQLEAIRQDEQNIES